MKKCRTMSFCFQFNSLLFYIALRQKGHGNVEKDFSERNSLKRPLSAQGLPFFPSQFLFVVRFTAYIAM